MTRHQSPDIRRDQILAAARRCFIDQGYEPTRMDDIARGAGLSKGGLYFHFSSKIDIFHALVAAENERCMSVLAAIGGAPGSATEKLAGLAGAYLGMAAGDPDKNRFLVVLGELGVRNADIAALLTGLHSRYIDALAALVREGIDAGEIREVDPRSAAVLLKAIIDGVEVSYAVGCEIDMQQLAITGLDILNHGLVRR